MLVHYQGLMTIFNLCKCVDNINYADLADDTGLCDTADGVCHAHRRQAHRSYVLEKEGEQFVVYRHLDG